MGNLCEEQGKGEEAGEEHQLQESSDLCGCSGGVVFGYVWNNCWRVVYWYCWNYNWGSCVWLFCVDSCSKYKDETKNVKNR